MQLTVCLLALLTAGIVCCSVNAAELPEPDALATVADLPDPLRMFDGTQIQTAEQWRTLRKPELKKLFQHYMYGYLPEKQAEVTGVVESEYNDLFGGKATMRQVTLSLGPTDCPTISLLVILPNKREANRPTPVFVGLNFEGNHTVLADPRIDLAKAWFRDGPGVVDHRATDQGRGTGVDRWQVEQIIDRGYGLATFCYGDITPDKPDLDAGMLPFFRPSGQTGHLPADWAAIAAWGWGVQRCVDYLVTERTIDAKRIIAFGHSRNGKAALFAAAFDDRIAAVIPHQAGCGGTAPSRRHNPKSEPVARINEAFPHWFNANFKKFNGQEEKLPFDQNCLVALCAPRAVLLSNGEQDQWADPAGQFDVLLAARPVYRLLGVDGIGDDISARQSGKLLGKELAYYVDDSSHVVNANYWKVFLDFADHALADTRK